MKKILAALAFVLFAASAQAQSTVAQGAPGSRAWLITFGAVAQPITCVSGCGSPPATPDLDTFTAGTTNVSPFAGVFNDGLANVVSGKQAGARVTTQRALHVNLRNASGTEVDASAVPTAYVTGSLTSTTCTGTGCLDLDVTGYSSAAVQITGTWDAILVFEGSVDGTNFQELYGTPNGASVVIQESAHQAFEGNQTLTFSVAGLKTIRVRANSYTSGTIGIAIRASASGVPDRIVPASLALPFSISTPNPGDSGLIVRQVPGETILVSAAGLQSGQTASGINGCQFDQPGTLPANHDYTTPRCDNYRGMHVSLHATNGLELGYANALSVGPVEGRFGNSQTLSVLNDIIQISCLTSCGSFWLDITGTWVGTLTFHIQPSQSSTARNPISVANVLTGAVGSTTTANGIFSVPSGGAYAVWVEATAWTSGTASVRTATNGFISSAIVIAAPPPLSTGAATNALQTTGNSSLSSIDGKTPALGQALAAASVPVILPAATITTLTPPAAITGFATSAKQDTAQTALDAIKLDVDKIPSQGQALAAASMPVVLTAAQITTLTPLATITANAGTNLNTSALALDATLTNRTQKAQVTDGTRDGTVKAASTLPLATDTALVTTLRDPLPAGSAVIGTVTANAGTNLNTSALALDATLTGRTQKAQITDGTRDGTVKAASTLPLLTDTAVVTTQRDPLPAGTNVLGHVIVDTTSTTAVTQATAANLNATVTPIALTKGTQGATGFTVQALNDAGRNQTNFFMPIQIVTTGTDALVSLTGYKGGAAVTGTTTPAVVTAGKTYRITSITMDYTTIITTPGSVRFTLRANTGGTVVITSPAVAIWEVGEPTGGAPVAGKKNTIAMTFPDGIEFAAGTGIGISQVGLNTVGVAAAVGYGRITINGYEY